VSLWVFSSNNIENIRVAKERLLWGFWDRDAGEKQRKNWRAFIRLYNKIKPFDVVVLQLVKTGGLYALGIVKRVYYDDQTPIWPMEINQNKVIYPWRVSFSIIIFFDKEPFILHYTNIENYLDGYGIGELAEHEFRRVLSGIQEQLQLNMDLNLG